MIWHSKDWNTMKFSKSLREMIDFSSWWIKSIIPSKIKHAFGQFAFESGSRKGEEELRDIRIVYSKIDFVARNLLRALVRTRGFVETFSYLMGELYVRLRVPR